MGSLEFFVPTNRVSPGGARRGMDGLNEIIRSARAGAEVSNRVKAENEAWIAAHARRAMAECGWEAPDRRCTVEVEFVEPDLRRDDDNVFAGAKFVLDALCAPRRRGRYVQHAAGCSAIRDDDPAHVRLVTRRGACDRRDPGMRVRVTEDGAGDGR